MWGAHETIYQNNLINFDLLNFYEISYFWIIKRFFLYNNLSVQLFFNKKVLNFNNKKKNDNFIFNDYFYFNNFLFKNNLNFVFNFNIFSLNFVNKNIFDNKITNYRLKDVSLNFEENTFFSIDNLKTCYWIVSPLSVNDKSEIFNFFSPLSYKPHFSKNFYLKQKTKNHYIFSPKTKQ